MEKVDICMMSLNIAENQKKMPDLKVCISRASGDRTQADYQDKSSAQIDAISYEDIWPFIKDSPLPLWNCTCFPSKEGERGEWIVLP